MYFHLLLLLLLLLTLLLLMTLLLLLTLLLLFLHSVLSMLLLSRFLCRNQCVRGFGAVAKVTTQIFSG